MGIVADYARVPGEAGESIGSLAQDGFCAVLILIEDAGVFRDLRRGRCQGARDLALVRVLFGSAFLRARHTARQQTNHQNSRKQDSSHGGSQTESANRKPMVTESHNWG